MSGKTNLIILTFCLVISLFSANKYIDNYYFNPVDKAVSVNFSDKYIFKQAKNNVVKIETKEKSGSGIILQHKKNRYNVVTNRHVVDRTNQIQITTSDNQIHRGILIATSSEDDLAILGFKSDRLYPVATIKTAPLQIQKSLIAMGFPYYSDRLKITSGQLLLQLEKPLKNGYQLGYSNDIQPGMSGGAIFNDSGELIGINGRSANPIIPDYQYQDNTYPAQDLQQKMRQLSWGIPIIKAVELLPDL